MRGSIGVTIGALALGSASASAAALAPAAKRSYPFKQLVAFGDELSDNGNGSYAHGITGSPADVYGFGTWTDGPVAVSYLADLLGVPLVDYAWGGCCGGGSFGATIDNSYTEAQAQYDGAPVPSVTQQIRDNYTAPGSPNLAGISSALQFIWVGENDLSEHTDAFYVGDPDNGEFAANISSRILADAEYLVQQGAPYVFVVGIYPKNYAPVTAKYLCSGGSCASDWGQVIQNANSEIESALKGSSYSKQFIYYDVYTFMVDVMNNKDSYGLTVPLTWFCDGDGNGNFTECISGSYTWEGATQYYWMNFIQPTTTVHQLIAQDMKSSIDSFFSS